MPSVIKTVSFDAADALRLARSGPPHSGPTWTRSPPRTRRSSRRRGWGGPNIWFIRVPEGKTAKNRVHFDLRAPGPAADEVARLEGLGATVLERHGHHVVMQDPEGNEFCVEPGPAS